MKVKLSLIDEKELNKRSSLLVKNLFNVLTSLDVIQKKICIGTYAPIEKEPLWFIDQWAELNDLTAFPAINAKSNLMIFKMARMSDLVIKKDFGFKILGPNEEAAIVTPGVVFVPGLAFTRQGDRLGRGKGFYDKYLSQYRGIKIGLCFEEQVEFNIPTEKHDVKLDYIVTENEIINCKFA